MSKLRKAILIIGILIVAVAASLGTALALYATGSMKTDPIKLVYVLREREKIYDGTPLKLDDLLNDIMLKEGKLSAGHYAKIEFLGSQTDVGESESDASVKIYDENGFNVTGDYSINVVGAPLTVYKKTISVELPTQKVVYNGSKVLFNEYRISDDSEGGLCSGHKIYGSTDASLMNVGDTLPDDLTPLIFDVTGKDVTANYDIAEFSFGGIEVIKRPVTVRPVSFEKVYDGKVTYADEIEFVEGSLVEGQTCEFVINEGYGDRIKDVDEIETQITSLHIFDYADGEKVDVTENYEFNLQEYTGYLKVTPRLLTVVAKSETFVYNGEEQSLKDDRSPLSVEGLAEGEELLGVSYFGSRKDVGKTENVITEVNLKGLTDNYEIRRVSGTIEVTPFETTIKTYSSEKYYDGDALTDGHVEYMLANAAHAVTVGELPSLTDVGEIPNAYKITVVDESDGNADCTHNYAITYDYGALTVKKLPVKVTLVSDADGREKVYYDGTVHSPALNNENYFTVEPLLPDGERVEKFTLGYADFETVAETRAMCVAGEYFYTVKFIDREVWERRRYSNYELYVPESGVLEVVPLPLSVTLKEYKDEAAFVYSGRAVKLDVTDAITGITLRRGVTLSDGVLLEKLIAEEDFSCVADEIIDAGENYLYTVKITDGNTAKNFDVEISGLAEGSAGVKIVVNSMTVTVTLADAERTYNGKAQTVAVSEAVLKIEKTAPAGADDDAADTGLAAGDLNVVFTETEPDKVKYAADYPFEVEIVKKRLRNNYTLTFKSAADGSRKYALLKIGEFELKVTTDTPDLTYNGKDQSSGAFTNGELANAKHTTKILTTALPAVRNVYETVSNRFEVAVFDGTEDVSDNYKIAYTYGTLSVKPLAATITLEGDSRPYNGRALSNATVTAEGLIAGHRIVVPEESDLPSLTAVGKLENRYGILIAAANGGSFEDVTENYDITFVYGYLEVTAADLTVTLNNYTGANAKEYTGKVHTVPAVKSVGVNYDGITAADLTFICFDETLGVCNMLDAGNYTYNVKITDETLARNYKLTAVDGRYEIVPANITVTLQNYEKTYSGTAYTVDAELAILSIKNGEGKETDILDKSDFKVVYSQELRLANGIVKPLEEGEVYMGETVVIEDRTYKVITGEKYSYGVELVDRSRRGNFNIITEGGEFKINKRLLTFTATNVYISKEDYALGGYADELEFDVTDYITISSNTSLADGDQFRIISAVAEKEYTDSTVLYLFAFDEYILTNEDCYEFTNVNGTAPVSLQLMLY